MTATSVFAAGRTDIPLKNWKVDRTRAIASNAVSADSIFVAITPCRVIDTREAGMGAYGSPSFAQFETRSYNMTGTGCSGIPVAVAYSLNVTIVNYNVASAGWVTLYPTGVARPFVSTVNFGNGVNAVANAAIVPADSNGSIDCYAAGATHVIIDINGYFLEQPPAGGVTSVTAGTGITATPTTGNVVVSVADHSITNLQLANGSVATGNIQTSAVTSNEILNGTIASEDLASASVATGNIQTGAVTSGQILNGTILTEDLASGSVATGNIQTGAVTSNEILNGTIASEDLASGSVATANIQTGAVTSNEILNGTIASEDLASGSVATANIQASAVTTAEILNGTIASEDLASGSVATANIQASAVTTAEILNGTIAAEDLATNSVATGNIQSGAVTTSQILNGTILSEDLAGASVATANIQTGAVTTAEILNGTILPEDLSTDSVTTAKIANANVTLPKISSAGAGAGQAVIFDGTNVVWANTLTTSNAAVHTTDVSNICSVNLGAGTGISNASSISLGGLNGAGASTAIVVVTANGGTTAPFTASFPPVAVAFVSSATVNGGNSTCSPNKWVIYTTDGTPMPPGIKFSVFGAH